MNWKPANDYMILKATLNQELKDSSIIRDYEHKDYTYTVYLLNEKDDNLKHLLGCEVLLPYPYLNNISEETEDPKADKFYYVNKLDIRLYREL